MFLTFFNVLIELIESIVSKSSTHFFDLFDWRCPINLFFRFGILLNDPNFTFSLLYSVFANVP